MTGKGGAPGQAVIEAERRPEPAGARAGFASAPRANAVRGVTCPVSLPSRLGTAACGVAGRAKQRTERRRPYADEPDREHAFSRGPDDAMNEAVVPGRATPGQVASGKAAPGQPTSGHATSGQATPGQRPADVAVFERLTELALDMRWSWNHATDAVWRGLDAELWESTHNPWVVLQTVSRARIDSLGADPVFRQEVERLVQVRRRAMEAPAWFQQQHGTAALGLRRLLQHGVHAERGAADLFGRPRQRRRRPAQVGQRSGRAGRRRRPALPAGLFPAGARQGRRPAGAVPHATIRASCPSRRCAAPTATGCACGSTCRASRSGCAPGRCRSGA